MPRSRVLAFGLGAAAVAALVVALLVGLGDRGPERTRRPGREAGDPATESPPRVPPEIPASALAAGARELPDDPPDDPPGDPGDEDDPTNDGEYTGDTTPTEPAYEEAPPEIGELLGGARTRVIDAARDCGAAGASVSVRYTIIVEAGTARVSGLEIAEGAVDDEAALDCLSSAAAELAWAARVPDARMRAEHEL